jgi:hypothetical protein
VKVFSNGMISAGSCRLVQGCWIEAGLMRLWTWFCVRPLRILAQAGATGVELMAVSAQSSLKQSQKYLDEVDGECTAKRVRSGGRTERYPPKLPRRIA